MVWSGGVDFALFAEMRVGYMRNIEELLMVSGGFAKLVIGEEELDVSIEKVKMKPKEHTRQELDGKLKRTRHVYTKFVGWVWDEGVKGID